MILVDYSQVALSNILSFQRELKGSESEIKSDSPRNTLNTQVIQKEIWQRVW